MADDNEQQGFFKQPRNVLLLVAAAFGLYMLIDGVIGIIWGSEDADSIVQQGPATPVTEALLALPASTGPHPDYSRSKFGSGWADLDGDGCDTRNEILSRDLEQVSYRDGTGDCVVESGVLTDPYTGTVIEFTRGESTSEEVQIDHVVPLADAWNSGAWEWDVLKREDFANDPLNLLAVQGQANQEKSAMTADQWLPSQKDYQCPYVLRQIKVKSTWGLGVTDAERSEMARVISGCPEQSLPVS